MNHVISAGILLKSKGKYLIAHPTNNTGTTHGWGIPKGKQDENEALFDTAIREFREETGLQLVADDDLKIETTPFFSFKVGNKKTVFAFRAFDLTGELSDFPFKCCSFFNSGIPEIDDFKWVECEDALDLVSDSQIRLFSEVIKRKAEEPNI